MAPQHTHRNRFIIKSIVRCWRVAKPLAALLFFLLLHRPTAIAQCTGTGMGATVALPIPGSWVANSVPPNMNVTLNVTTTMGSTAATVTGCNASLVGATVSGPNFPAGTTVVSACPAVFSQPATATGSAQHTFILGPYALPYPPQNAGLPTNLYCSVCPSLFTSTICANQYINIQACAGNLYTISLCSSSPASNFSLSLTQATATFPAVAAGYYGQPFDNDGCGTANGPSTLQFSPQTSGIYRFRVFENPCVVNAGLCGTITVQCSVPSPPANDTPCAATALPVPTVCNYQLTNVLWGTTSVGYPTPTCGAYAGRDVWYSAVVPASGNLQVQASLVSASSIGIAAYTTPSCNAPQASWTQLACAPPPGPPAILALSGLAAPGSTVYIRVWPQGNISNQGTFNICAFEPTPPQNDLPCGNFLLATPITCAPNTYTTEFAGNTIPPGITLAAPTCGLPVNNDVWFTVTVPASGAFTVNTFPGTLSDMGMAWYRLSGGGSVCNPPGFSGTLTQIACNDDQFAPTNLMPRINSQTTIPAIAPPLAVGETIYVRVWQKVVSQGGTFTICATENVPPPNDDPCGALPLATALACNLVLTSNEGAGLTAGLLGAGQVPGCGAPVANDVWYSVTVPPNGQLEINTQGIGMTDAALALYQSSGGCAPANLTLVPPVNCQTGGSSFGAAMPQQLFAGLLPGSTVYVRVWRQTGNVGQFNICARQTAAAPISGCDLNTSDSGGPLGTYGNNEIYEQTFCPVNPGDVVAIDFTAFNTQANNDLLTIYNGPSIASPVLGIFSGGALPPGFVSSHSSGCLTIRFTSNASVVAPGWQISVSCGPPLPPPPAPVGICGTTTYDSGGPTGVYANNEVITQTFCPSVPGEVVTMTFTQFSVEQNFDFLTVFNGPSVASPVIGGPFTGNVNPGTFTSTDPSGCLTIRFTSDFSIVAAGWAATLRCGAPQPPPPPPPPPSGICGTTVYDPGGPGGNTGNGVNQNPNNFGGNNCWPYTCIGGGATAPPGQPFWSQTYCPSVAGDAVTITFNTFNLETGWDNMYLYNGPVVSPNNANGTQFLSGGGLPTCGAPAGWCNQTFGAGGFTGNVNPGSFTSTHPSGCLTITMTSDDIINFAGWSATITCQSGFDPTDDCIFALRMYDTFGDGWAGSYITVVINGGTPSYYTVTTGTFNQILISADNGDNISISYNGLGYFPGDNSWTFDQVGAQYSIHHSAVPAVHNANFLNYTVNCSGQPAAPQQDCPGATVLCNSNPVVMQSTHIGSVGDLTTTSGGCLSIYEEQGKWYTFTAGNTNPMGFTITPAGTTDINFAVWGPFTNQSLPATICAPLGAPIRCSFASAANTFGATGSYATGMGSAVYSPPQYAPPGTPYSETIAGDGWVSGITPAQGDVYLLYVSNATSNSTAATLTWTGTGVVDCVILPVELLDFNAVAGQVHVDVKWTTGSERNSAWFNVQRSSDGSNFTTIGRVNAAGHSNGSIEYLLKDHSPLPGLSYYRLEQVDVGGSTELSHMVPVFFRGGASLQVYPNPARNELTMAIELGITGYYDWVVLDGSGRVVLRDGKAFEAGAQRIVMAIEELEAGAYQVVLRQAGTERGRARFVKQ